MTTSAGIRRVRHPRALEPPGNHNIAPGGNGSRRRAVDKPSS